MEDPNTMADTKPAAEPPVVNIRIQKLTDGGAIKFIDAEVITNGNYDGTARFEITNAPLEVGQVYAVRGRGLSDGELDHAPAPAPHVEPL
jgi:hypothetical protein